MEKEGLTVKYFIMHEAAEHWDEVAELVNLVMPKMHGEMELTDFPRGFISGHFHLFVIYRDNVPTACMVTENAQYYRTRGFRVIAAAGADLKQFMIQYKDYLNIWVKANKGSFLEAWTDPAMTRYFRRLGAKKVYDIIRFPVEG